MLSFWDILLFGFKPLDKGVLLTGIYVFIMAIFGYGYFSDCMGCLTENRFCDTRYRINCHPSFVFFENNCPYILQYPTSLMNFELKYTIK